MENKITEFRGQYFWLSNFFLAPVKYEGKLYPSTEHAYQAAKSLNLSDRAKIKKLTAAGAKRFGDKVKLRKDWESIKINIMYELNKQKFTKHKDLAEKLLNTEDCELIEGNTWGDSFWGICNGFGRNELGKILMKIRKELRKEDDNNKGIS